MFDLPSTQNRAASLSKFRNLLFFTLFFASIASASVPQAKEDRIDEEKSAAKERYDLFNPVPETHLREFHPDRPGSTNTPYTVDAGHFQPEIELVNYSKIPTDAGNAKNLNLPNPNVRVGLTNSIEMDVAWMPYVLQTASNGIGDFNLRLKKNLRGNEGGAFAWALMPGIKIPTNTHDVGDSKWEPNLLVPFSLTLRNKWAISWMPEIDVRKNQSRDGYHTEYNLPFTFGHHLVQVFDGYVEFVSHSNTDRNSSWMGYVGTGITARTSRNSQIDAGINIGINSATPAYNPFAGWVFRI